MPLSPGWGFGLVSCLVKLSLAGMVTQRPWPCWQALVWNGMPCVEEPPVPRMPMKPVLMSGFGSPPQIPGLLQKAMALHERGDLQQASRIYQQILNLSPEYFDATHLLAVVNAQVGQHIKARALFVRALAMRPGHAEAHFNKGTMEGLPASLRPQ
jgi:tetratricopeptide (TPR) repeat protein